MVEWVGVCIERLFVKVGGWHEAGGVVDDEGLTRFGAWMGREREKERKRRAERHDWILMYEMGCLC